MQKITTVLLTLVLILVIPTLASAETKKFKTYSYITKMHFMPVKIAKAPAEVILERRGVVQYEDGEEALFYLQGTAKITPTVTTAEGYSQYTFKDGSTNVLKWQAEMSKKDGEKLASGTGSGTYVSGTGRLEGIKGECNFKSRYLTPYAPDKGTWGDLISEGVSNYTLPDK
jgi:hypothetical protein